MTKLILEENTIISHILLIRGKKIILDRNLADLYQVETKRLNEQVKRNIKRFPSDFMFQLSDDEFKDLKSQYATSSWGGVRKLPFAFTENGVAMLSGILNSDRAIHVNIQIMRTFTQLRTIIEEHKDLREILAQMERKYDQQFKVVFEAIRHIIQPNTTPIKKIGFIKDQ